MRFERGEAPRAEGEQGSVLSFSTTVQFRLGRAKVFFHRGKNQQRDAFPGVWRVYPFVTSTAMSHSPARRHWFLYTTVILALAGAIWYFATRAPKRSSNYRSYSSMPVPVRAVKAVRADLPVHLRAIGTVTPLNTVTVRSRVEGELLKVAFAEGQEVKKGDVLAEVDAAPYRIRLAQMEAQLRQNQAQLQTARSDLERLRQLGGQALVSQQQLEAQGAQVAEREAALAADQAQVEDARRQLDYTRIEAPISGRLGLRSVDVGNLIRPGDANGIVVIKQTRPIAVMFTVPEMDLQKVIGPLRAGEKLAVQAWDRSEQTMLASGTLKTVDNQIDLSTGTLRLKAEFPNQDESLFPNQFVNIRLRVQTLKAAVLVPSAVVQFGSRGTYVYIVNEQSQSMVRDVVIGPADGALQAILSGLQPGEQVVIEGLDRLRDGRVVTVLAEGAATAPPPPPQAPSGEKGSGGKKKRT